MIAISLPFWLSGNRNNSGQGRLFPGGVHLDVIKGHETKGPAPIVPVL